jgi:hypothetical protein
MRLLRFEGIVNHSWLRDSLPSKTHPYDHQIYTVRISGSLQGTMG